METAPLSAETVAPRMAQGLIADLWRRRLDTLICGIANGDSYYQQIANAAEHISAEYQGRFLVELIQNANDQAVRANLSKSLVTITRVDGLIAVGNSGQPFDEPKVDAITSIFKSDKSADACIGNKGIGFKAVFQIADSAEIFSSMPGGSLADGCSTGLRLVRRPFDEAEFVAKMRDLAVDLLGRYDDRRLAIEDRFPGEAAADVVLREAGRAAWFTFPLPSTAEQFDRRVLQLSLSAEVLSETQTLIVLPLDRADATSERVSRAIDEIQGDRHSVDAPPAASFLFLPGISRIRVVDSIRGFHAELEKRETYREDLGDGFILSRRLTSARLDLVNPNVTSVPRSQEWWVVERIIGGRHDGDQARATSERQALREAIQALRLPAENWKDVEQVPVAVALPDPRQSDSNIATLGAAGRFCIGLPTRVVTGLPLWVSAHFHGKIDRTAIDFENAYNGLLFSAAVKLTAVLIEWLKRESGVATKRLVTLAMERNTGILADALYADDGLAHQEVVLGADGLFVRARDLCVPSTSDLRMFRQLATGVADIAAYGFRLPDDLLLEGARNVLDGLAQDIEAPDTHYLKRPLGSVSMLEHAARRYRADGPGFWEPFLTWILDRFSVRHLDALQDQAIIPTGHDDLASPQARVFFPPMGLAARGSDEAEGPQAIDDAGDELATIDNHVALLLKLFDESAIKVRTGVGREYTSLAQRLSPPAGGGLVRAPRQTDLINDAVVPALRESKRNNERALALLRQALIWLVAMPVKSKERVAVDELLVPVSGDGEAWEWIGPDGAYLGEGWDTDPSVGLLTKAYANRRHCQLIPWDRFEKKAFQLSRETDRTWWLDRMRDIGVWDCPRIIRADRRIAVAVSYSNRNLTPIETVCPVPCPVRIWASYLRRISQRPARTRSGQEYYLKEIAWIDGLEREEIRATVVEAVLRHPERYQSSLNTETARRFGEDNRETVALWVHALETESWAVVPTNRGLRATAEAWYVPADVRSSRHAFLPCVRTEFTGARWLLQALGVRTLEEAATFSRLVSAIQELAGCMEKAGPEEVRQIEALAVDIYEAMEKRLEANTALEEVKSILNGPVPLLHDEKIEIADLNVVDRIVIVDDAVRRQHISEMSHSWTVPSRFDATYERLTAALRDVLGPERVVRVSECPINIAFTPMEEGIPLLDYLRIQYPRHQLAEDIGLLLVKGGSPAPSPYDDLFQKLWSQILRVHIVRGTFQDIDQQLACFDAHYRDAPTLMVKSQLEPYEIVGQMWQLVGPRFRPVWTEYSDALKEGRTDAFFVELGVSPTERTEVEVKVGLGFEQRLRRYQPVCLALWRRSVAGLPIDEFHREWTSSARTADTAAQWLNWPELLDNVELATRSDEPAGSLSLLSTLGLSVEGWQDARRELGNKPWRFEASEVTYVSAKGAIAGHLRAWCAYLVVPRASGGTGPTVSVNVVSSVSQLIDQVHGFTVPIDVAEASLSSGDITARVAQDILRAAIAIPALQDLAVLLDPLQELVKAAPSETSSIRLKDEPDKAATIYQNDDDAVRAEQAVAAVDTILRVAAALATKLGESLDAAAIRQHRLVVLLNQGAWANRVSVLAAVRYALEKATPVTASRMKDRQTFRDLDDWRTLWMKFEELGDIPKPVAPPPAKTTFVLLGSSWTEDQFGDSAAAGPTGELARRLLDAVIPNLDLASLRDRQRAKVQAKARRSGKGARGHGATKRAPDEYLTMLGAVGEHFVYDQMKIVLPGWDLTNWRSKAKKIFGYGEGNDELGYDFECIDVGGKLTGRLDSPHCFIEVKSAASEYRDTFEMSTNEWEVALECHRERNTVYVIIRVANTASKPQIVDVLVDPVALHLEGVLDYSSRDLLIALGKPTTGESGTGV